MPLPLFWICMGLTSVAIGAVVYFEASHRYHEYREWQEYQRYAHTHASARDSAHYDNNNGFDGKNSDDGDDIQDDKHKAFVRKLQSDDHELRRRLHRPTAGAAETSTIDTSDYSGSSNRPVADKVN